MIAAAALVAVVAFVLLKPDDEGDEQARPSTTTTAAQAEGPSPPRRIILRAGAPRGGIARIEASKDDLVRIVVSSDRPDEIHLHGYDITREAAPGRPARFRLRADVEGSFEIESHTAEHAGREPLIGRLVVEP